MLEALKSAVGEGEAMKMCGADVEMRVLEGKDHLALFDEATQFLLLMGCGVFLLLLCCRRRRETVLVEGPGTAHRQEQAWGQSQKRAW